MTRFGSGLGRVLGHLLSRVSGRLRYILWCLREGRFRELERPFLLCPFSPLCTLTISWLCCALSGGVSRFCQALAAFLEATSRRCCGTEAALLDPPGLCASRNRAWIF